MKILIDPGHGGKDTGAIGPSGLAEKDVNLRIAFFLKSLLQNDGFEVLLTRTRDITLTLKERVEIAKRHSPCLFFSIHHNANAERNTHINRFEVFVPFDFEGPSVSLGKKLAEIFSRKRGQIPLGPMPARYTVLKSSPFSLLVEPGYIINPEEEKKLRDEAYLREEAKLLYEGIIWALKDGCHFKLHLKRHTSREIVISRKGVNLVSYDITIDDTPWEQYSIDDENIRILFPASWKTLRITGTTDRGIEIFPFEYKNPDYLPIVSFSQSVKEYGNLKLIHLSFFDEKGEFAEKGLKVSLKANQGKILKSSGSIEDKGSVYILLKTDRPENDIEISFKGFQAITNVHSIEDLRHNEISGVVESKNIPLENVVIKKSEGYTISGKLGVFKTQIDHKLTFIKRGFYPFYLIEPEPQKNYFVEMTPLFLGLVKRHILIRPSSKNIVYDGNVKTFSSILKHMLETGGATIEYIKTDFPGWDNEPSTVRTIQHKKPDVAIKIQSRENKFILLYYYKDTETLEILKRISSYFYKLGIHHIELRESSDYFAIHPSGRRIIINIPFNVNAHIAHLYVYPIFLGLEHYFANEPVNLEKIEGTGQSIITEYGLFSLPVMEDGSVFVPQNLFKLKLYTEEQTCIHSPDGN